MKKKIFCISVLIFMICAFFSDKIFHFVIAKNDSLNQLTSSNENLKDVTLECGDLVYFGKYYDDPILWRVCKKDEGRILLFCEQVICFKRFDFPENHSDDSGKDRLLFGSSDWENSTLKKWLNSKEEYDRYYCESGFLNASNFNDPQRQLITNDGVFLLSHKMLVEIKKQFTITRKCTDMSVKRSNLRFYTTSVRPVWYWTSSPINTNNVSVTCVTSSGGFYKTLANDEATGVCPALYLNSDQICSTDGDGSVENPYCCIKGGV